ncbi:hypothetical protein L596_001552 [Steinernema carpocapsae]|uniref:Uncharacterized protein n=1 Tax=Steinernema carpocapsae TaxID=34508 RepID=A0A4U8UM33_STECR|nr:hypothetical protein L596_001552 [Steinernema carpocapsae]
MDVIFTFQLRFLLAIPDSVALDWSLNFVLLPLDVFRVQDRNGTLLDLVKAGKTLDPTPSFQDFVAMRKRRKMSGIVASRVQTSRIEVICLKSPEFVLRRLLSDSPVWNWPCCRRGTSGITGIPAKTQNGRFSHGNILNGPRLKHRTSRISAKHAEMSGFGRFKYGITGILANRIKWTGFQAHVWYENDRIRDYNV